jgi:hypothetical protein
MKHLLTYLLLLTATLILAAVTARDGYWSLTIACIAIGAWGTMKELDRRS